MFESRSTISPKTENLMNLVNVVRQAVRTLSENNLVGQDCQRRRRIVTVSRDNKKPCTALLQIALRAGPGLQSNEASIPHSIRLCQCRSQRALPGKPFRHRLRMNRLWCQLQARLSQQPGQK